MILASGRVLWRGGHVYTPADPFATAMLTDGGDVAWVGADGAADAHRDSADVVVDLAGALVAPAFVDSHVHLTDTGLALLGLDLSAATSLADLLDRVERAARDSRGRHVLGHGWDETAWPERRPPTREELDRASYGGVVYLTRVDVHSAVVSSALLAVVDGAGSLPGYSGGGWVSRDAHHACRTAALATVPESHRDDARRAARGRAAECGIAAVHECGGPQICGDADFAAVLALAAAEPGPEVVGYWGELGAVERARTLGAAGAAGDLFVDGALGSRTACLREAYADDDGHGHAYLTAADVRDHVVACTRAGLQAGFHVIGDAATDTVVRGLSAAADVVGREAVRAARHRLEHLEMADAEALRTLADLGVTASVQPAFDAAWGGEAGMYAARVGPQRARAMNPFAAMSATGVALALGSDAPVTAMDPWGTVRAAAFHRTPEHRVSVRAAFNAHTRGGWRAARRDDAGALVPGAPAHLAVWAHDELVVQAPDDRVSAWSTDPRSGTPGLPDLTPGVPLPRCLRTVVAGVTVHDTGELSEVTP